MTDELSAIYARRFADTGLARRDRVWKVLTRNFIQRFIAKDARVLDLACGYGEFSNNIIAGKKHAVDLNQDAPRFLAEGINFMLAPATKIPLPDASIDAVFTSNFLEHLHTKEECLLVFKEIYRLLEKGGRFIILGPNIRYAYREYWDFFDHHLALSHHSLEEGLRLAGFDVTYNVPRFLPYTMAKGMPAHPILVSVYLKFPLLWRIFGRQFFVVAVRN